MIVRIKAAREMSRIKIPFKFERETEIGMHTLIYSHTSPNQANQKKKSRNSIFLEFSEFNHSRRTINTENHIKRKKKGAYVTPEVFD